MVEITKIFTCNECGKVRQLKIAEGIMIHGGDYPNLWNRINGKDYCDDHDIHTSTVIDGQEKDRKVLNVVVKTVPIEEPPVETPEVV